MIYDASVINPEFMLRCLDLASQGRGRVGNGALVGAVLVRPFGFAQGDSRIIAEGYHVAYGEPHAEWALLSSYQEEIKPEDVLYVNLEPCCHQGKTPPCTDIILERGIKTIVYGMLDPDSRVTGNGIETLESAGVTVIGPVERSRCEYFNKGYRSVRQQGRPWITIKMAKDKADRISNTDGSRLKITSREQDVWSHSFLRNCHDAILVGVGSIISDNPKLNRRFDQKSKYSRLEGLNEDTKNENNSLQPYRIVLDPECRIPLDAKVLSDESPATTILCIGEQASETQSEKIRELRETGIRIEILSTDQDGFEWSTLWQALITPHENFPGITSILVEGGPKTWKSFTSASFVDEEITLIGR